MILHPGSASILPTDALGAQAIRQFRLGQSATGIGKWLRRQCPDAEKRWQRLVGALYDRGAAKPRAPRRTYRWWIRTVATVLLGPAVSLITLMLSVAPLWLLRRFYEWVPSTLLSARTRNGILPSVEANLCAAGFGDWLPAWRRDVAQKVAAATVRTHFAFYLSLLLPREKVFRLLEQVTVLRGMDHLLEAYKAHDGAIVVALHSDLYLAPAMHMGRVLPLTVLANLGAFEYSMGSDRKPPASAWNDWVDSKKTSVVKTLLRRLRSGRITMLFFDVPLSSDTRGTPARRIPFFGHNVVRYDTAAWLAVRTGKPILLASTYQEGDRLVVDFSAPLLPAPDRAPSEQVAHLTRQVYKAAEQLIRLHPDAWLVWSYWHMLVVPPR